MFFKKVSCELMVRNSESYLDTFEVSLGFIELRKETLFGLELAGVDTATASLHADGMLQVKHLMVEQILDGTTRGIGTVEDATDDDGVVGGVVVAEHATGVVGAPGKGGAAEETVEETAVEGLEDFVEVVVVADGGENALAAAGLADVLGLTGDGFRGDVAAVAVGVCRSDWLFVEFGQ